MLIPFQWMLETGVLMKSRRGKITIAVISVTILIIIAAVIAAIVITTVLGNKDTDSVSRYYEGSFRIKNLNYKASYGAKNSADFKALSVQIQELTKATFEDSDLKSLYNTCKVISLGSGIVEPTLVILFQVPPSEMKKFSSAPIQNIFRKILTFASRLGFTIDMGSVQLSDISVTEGDNLLYGECGIGGPTASSRIVGGVPATSGSWPWQASLRFNGRHKCGAALISNTWLVSAAHCFELSKDANKWTVVLGSISSSPGFGLEVQRIIVYDTYSSENQANDIALLQLSAPVRFKENVRTVCLPKASDNFADGSSSYVTGWGAQEYEGPMSTVLRQAEVKIINSDLCGSPQMYGSTIKPSMLCAGYVEGKIDACQGDSGGPLVSMQNTDNWFLIGVVSFGDECALRNKPGVYSRITYLRNWITQNSGL